MMLLGLVAGGAQAASDELAKGHTAGISVGFEEKEGYPRHGKITEIQGWSVSEEARGTMVEEASVGTQSLQIEAGEEPVVVEYRAKGVPDAGVRFISLSVKPTKMLRGEPTMLHLWGSEISFTLGEEGYRVQLGVIDGETGEVDAPLMKTQVRLNEGGTGERWIHLMIRQDLNATTWDLFLDGKLVAINRQMAESNHGFGVLLSPYEVIGIDEISIGVVNPLFLDSDGDGMPDAFELAHHLNPYSDDRQGDKDGDGIRNIEEYLAGTPPNIAGGGAAAQIIYVDNASGKDTNSGSHASSKGGDGPKFSIKAAMASASDGAVIIVLPGTGVYKEGSRSAKGKRITIRTVKPVTIQ